MAPSALTNRRILVVEDEFLIALELEMTLQDAQALVLGPVSRVQAGLELVTREIHISAAILDVNVRGEGVFPVADALLERSVPFLFATGEHPDAIPRRFAGIEIHQKPVDAAGLVRQVAVLVARQDPH